MNYGIKTGYNKAFVIDNQTKEALMAKDPRSAELLKPVLRGRDIRRYRADWAGLWLIDTHNGYGDVPAIEIDDYPAIKGYLDGFYPRLERRYDKGRTPYNLRNCAYHEDFSREKLLWMDMSNEGRFAYSDTELYCNDKGFLMTGDNLKYLCAVLNSSLIAWLMKNTGLTTGMGLMQWKKFAVERLPIPSIVTIQQQQFDRQVDAILQRKEIDPRASTVDGEAIIDDMVNDLYGLTNCEIRVVRKALVS